MNNICISLKSRQKKKLLAAVLFVSVHLFFVDSTQAQTDKAPLGMNLSYVRDWSTQLAFVDVFKRARQWIPQQFDDNVWDTGDTLNIDQYGWIASLDSGKAAGTLLFIGVNGNYPSGTYVCLYEGTGSFQFGFDATVTSSQPGRILLSVSPSEMGIHMKIVETDPVDPIRNIRVIMPGFEDTYQSQPFHPKFLELMGNFKVIRFMDWMETNNSTIKGME